jgi:SAM-dependent methyltransferase
MTSPILLTDSKSLHLHRARAVADGLFLHDLASDEMQDRMSMVNRPFNSVAVVSGFPEYWSNTLPNATSVTDDETINLALSSYDVVIHALGLQWANDPVGQIIQCRRALKPDGLFLSASFGGETLHELRSCLGQAEIEMTGGLSPRVAPMGEIRDMGGLLQRAGLALPVADTQKSTVVYRDIWHLMHDLRGMGETNALNTRLRTATRRTVFERANELYQTTFPASQGGINATFEILYLTGWSPDQSQQKALRPGSASARLADALKTEEKPLSD